MRLKHIKLNTTEIIFGPRIHLHENSFIYSISPNLKHSTILTTLYYTTAPFKMKAKKQNTN